MTQFLPPPDQQSLHACDAVCQARICGTVLCVLCELSPPLLGFVGELQAVFNGDLTALLDAFAVVHHLKPLGHQWDEVDADTAAWICVRLLSRDLAYGTEIMSESVARSLTQRFTTACGVGAEQERWRYFTNGKIVDGPTMYTVHLQRLLGWTPATEADYDTGVIVVTRRRMGLLWAADDA